MRTELAISMRALVLLAGLLPMASCGGRCTPDAPPSLEEYLVPASESQGRASVLALAECDLRVSLSEACVVDDGLWVVITASSSKDYTTANLAMQAIQDRLNGASIANESQSLLLVLRDDGSPIEVDYPRKECRAYWPGPKAFIYQIGHTAPKVIDKRNWRDPVVVHYDFEGWVHVQSRVPVAFSSPRKRTRPTMASLNPDASWAALLGDPSACIVSDLVPVTPWRD